MEPIAESAPKRRGRPRKYANEDEARAARAEKLRQQRQDMRENDPEGYKEWVRARCQKEADRFRAARALVEAAEQDGECATQEEVEAARAYVERVRGWRKGQFKRYYDSHPEFRERHKEKVAEYGRQKYAARSKNASAT